MEQGIDERKDNEVNRSSEKKKLLRSRMKPLSNEHQQTYRCNSTQILLTKFFISNNEKP